MLGSKYICLNPNRQKYEIEGLGFDRENHRIQYIGDSPIIAEPGRVGYVSQLLHLADDCD